MSDPHTPDASDPLEPPMTVINPEQLFRELNDIKTAVTDASDLAQDGVEAAKKAAEKAADVAESGIKGVHARFDTIDERTRSLEIKVFAMWLMWGGVGTAVAAYLPRLWAWMQVALG